MTTNASSTPAASGMTVVVHWNVQLLYRLKFPSIAVISSFSVSYLESEFMCNAYVLNLNVCVLAMLGVKDHSEA